jgi:hypothetical protein
MVERLQSGGRDAALDRVQIVNFDRNVIERACLGKACRIGARRRRVEGQVMVIRSDMDRAPSRSSPAPASGHASRTGPASARLRAPDRSPSR